MTTLFVQVLLSIIMIPQYGVVGASAARFIAYVVLIIPLFYELHRIGDFDFDRIALKLGLIGSALISFEIIVIVRS